MSNNTGKLHLYPTAPTAPPTTSDDFQRGPPPPSYEECLKMPSAGSAPPPQPYYNSIPYQQQQQQMSQPPPSYQMPQHSFNYSMPGPGPSTSYGYANPYQTHMQQQHVFFNASVPVASMQALNTMQKPSENVLFLAKGAKVRTTATGAISIPPPPPGCAPTPAQLAAMSGQPVMIKKQKKSFF